MVYRCEDIKHIFFSVVRADKPTTADIYYTTGMNLPEACAIASALKSGCLNKEDLPFPMKPYYSYGTTEQEDMKGPNRYMVVYTEVIIPHTSPQENIANLALVNHRG